MPIDRASVEALKNIIAEVETIISTTAPMPENRSTAADPLFDVSTDAFQPYETAIDGILFERANHAQIVKLFSHHVEEGRERYSPARFVSVAKDAVTGMPDLD